MSTSTKLNLRADENAAPKLDMPAEMEARRGRKPIGGKTLGRSLLTLAAGFRLH